VGEPLNQPLTTEALRHGEEQNHEKKDAGNIQKGFAATLTNKRNVREGIKT
jgi:hypothetical protein